MIVVALFVITGTFVVVVVKMVLLVVNIVMKLVIHIVPT